MSNFARKWFSRAPRYVLRPEDNQFIRFANQRNRVGAGIEILNISKTGMAFTVHRSQSPRIGEVVMVEFEVPGENQMACYARVVRLEEASTKSVSVGVHFINLQRGQIRNLSSGLRKKFDELEAQQNRIQFRRKLNWLKENIRLGILYIACILALVFVFYYLTQPRANYNKFTTVPWGARTF